MSVSATEVARAAVEFWRQGLGEGETEKRLKASIQYAKISAMEFDEAAELIGKYEIVPAAVAKKAIPACNITFLAGGEMRQALSGYLNVLFEQNPKAVGGALPADDFYYNAK